MFESLILWETSKETFHWFCLPIKIPSLFLFYWRDEETFGSKIASGNFEERVASLLSLESFSRVWKEEQPPPIPHPGQLALGG